VIFWGKWRKDWIEIWSLIDQHRLPILRILNWNLRILLILLLESLNSIRLILLMSIMRLYIFWIIIFLLWHHNLSDTLSSSRNFHILLFLYDPFRTPAIVRILILQLKIFNYLSRTVILFFTLLLFTIHLFFTH